ncbi:MAG: hypothetical protein HY700_03715 [Gemmatimonadetes bacterium]|nr:hypothetical protein [Gemmatimonadota bacterium]
MSHVDEGTLAAYLDAGPPEGGRERQGTAEVEAHLTACADCRARLDTLRRERETARAILRAGLPARSAASFADVLERSRARSEKTADRRRLSRLTSLAWAATVILAVAVGWYAREASFRPDVVGSTGETRAAIDSSGPASPAPEPAAAAATAVAPPRTARRASDRFRAGGGPQAQSPVVAAAPRVPESRRDAAAAGGLVDNRRVLAGKPSAELKQAERQLAGAAEGLGVRAGANAPAPLMKAASISPWADTTADAAVKVLGGRPLLIAGAMTTSYAVSVTGLRQVRITQRLGDGTVVELIEGRTPAEAAMEKATAPAALGRPSGAPRAAPAPVTQKQEAGAGLREETDAVSVSRGGYLVTLRVVIAADKAVRRDSLERLLSKLR